MNIVLYGGVHEKKRNEDKERVHTKRKQEQRNSSEHFIPMAQVYKWMY